MDSRILAQTILLEEMDKFVSIADYNSAPSALKVASVFRETYLDVVHRGDDEEYVDNIDVDGAPFCFQDDVIDQHTGEVLHKRGEIVLSPFWE